MDYLAEIFQARVSELIVGFFGSFLPKLILVLVIFLIGWLVAEALRKILANFLKMVGLDAVFEKKGWTAALRKAGVEFSMGEFIGEILKWVIVLFVLMIIGDYLRLESFSQFLQKFLLWIPNLLVAIFIFVVMVILADILGKIFRTWAEGIKVSNTAFLEGLIKGAIYTFGVFIILEQLQVGQFVVHSLIIAILATLSLSFSLALGLAGKDVAKEILEELRSRFLKK